MVHIFNLITCIVDIDFQQKIGTDIFINMMAKKQQRNCSKIKQNTVVKPNKQALFNELKGITTIDLAFRSASILEKIMWMIILLIGTIWASYFIQLQFVIWDQQPSIIIKSDNVKLSDLNYPAMTFCSKAVFPIKTPITIIII